MIAGLRVNSLLLLSLLFIISCQKNTDFPESHNYSDVDEPLIIYFERFEAEAKLRGVDADLISAGITGKIINITMDNIAGQCFYGSHQSPHVNIDSEFWESVGDNFREMVVFHELGHCFLNRGHLEDQTQNGICLSIMRSGTGSCIDNYRPTTRTAYIDELFLNL